MKNFCCLIIVGWLLSYTQALWAQEPCGVVYYDLGGLYDTEPSPFGGDEAYLPEGSLAWGVERYEAALDRYAALIDTLAMPLVALFGVENEEVALALAARSRGDYAVVHRTSARRDGLDFALLYQADRFLPGRVESDYGLLQIEGELMGRPVLLLLTNDPEAAAERVEVLCRFQERTPLIVLGNTGAFAKGAPLCDALLLAERAGRGTRLSRGGWWMRDRIWLGNEWEPLRADVYADRMLFDEESGAPLPLYDRERYRGGWSRNLPVFLYFRAVNLEN